ncbi:hypothetical protein pEaSNUABM38_00127 [Erwinia phage pEa_SNUABM_38]|nr:hypothetical protein pEaSNUABM38_00127 [Erwinia phage pEa_SNUABM_38]
MKTTLLAVSIAVMTLTACDQNKPQAVYQTDESKEERLYLACLEAVKVKVKAGEDNLEDAITSCRTNANVLSSKLVYTHANGKAAH